MTHVVSGKLRKAPFIKTGCGPQGDSTMYAIELSEMIKSWNSDEKFYANYKALFFAKTQASNEFYAKAFAEGSFVSVACEKLKVEQRDHEGTIYVSLQMENPRLEGALPFVDQGAQGNPHAGGWGQPNQPQQPTQQAAPQQRAPQQNAQPQYNEPPASYDQYIPF